MKEKLKKQLPYIFAILFVIFYFEYSVSITWDSAHYMGYVNIFEGNAAWNTWDVVRGPIFPIIIYFGNVLFGKTAQGLIMNTLLFYIVMLVLVYKILDYVFSKHEKKRKKVFIFFILFSIIINPIIYGFYHTLLTEFVAITLSVLSCYLAILWLDTDVDLERKKYLIISIIFAILTVGAWFLKQPYISCGFFALLVAYTISILQNRNLKNFLFRTGSVLFCLIILIISIKSWNSFLSNVGNDPNSSRNPTVSLGNQLIGGIYFLRIDNDANKIFEEQYIQASKLDKKEKKQVLEMLKNNEEYLIINIYDGNSNLIGCDYLKSKNGNVGVTSSILYILNLFFDNPLKVLDAYLTNYLSIIDIYSTSTNDGANYKSSREVNWMFSNEIKSISNRPYGYGNTNIFAMTPELYERVSCYEQINYVFIGLNYVMLLLSNVYLILFKIMFLLLPVFLIFSIVLKFKKNRVKNSKKSLNLVIILLGYSFLHMMLHTVTGAIIDRYAIPSFLTVYLGEILILSSIIKNLKFKKEKNKYEKKR